MLDEFGYKSPLRKQVLIASSSLREFADILPIIDIQYDITQTDNGYEAASLLESNDYFIAALDSDLPGMGGFNAARKARQAGRTCPIMMLTHSEEESEKAEISKAEGLCHGHIQRPFDPYVFLDSFWGLCDQLTEESWAGLPQVQSEMLISSKKNFDWITEDLVKHGRMEVEAVDACTAQVIGAVDAGEAFDALNQLWSFHQETYTHSIHSAALITMFAQQIGLSAGDVRIMTTAGFLHDIGKVKIDKSILNKPDRLVGAEWDNMLDHPIWSAQFIRETIGLSDHVAVVAERHHERLDGSGYPQGLKGLQLDDLSLAMAIVDIYSAMVTPHPYAGAMHHEEALAIMREMRGKQIEEGFFDRFEEVMLDLY